MRIQQLSAELANQIAAGEVIERPASVVKELLENALDAGADTISIDIGYGGLTQIKVADNGRGIVADDLPLAIAAHATSKISRLKDLYEITTMGFRGEALASIASISHLTISSKPAEQEHAMMLTSSKGKIEITPCARSQGTTIDVRDIFYNAPVRKKFLKPERFEFQTIEFIVKRFALSAPHVAISLSHNGKQHLQLTGANCDQTKLIRIRKLLGKTFFEQSCHLDVEHAGMRLEGFIGSKEFQRSQNDKIWVYVNNRMVKDKLLNHAIKQAYESILYPGRHPGCLLYLTIKADQVDVNVHPTKHEVRFQQPRLVHDFISSQLLKGLEVPQQQVAYKGQALKNPTFEVREPYSPPALPASTEGSKDLKPWVSLNQSFALLFLQDKPYLIDIIALQRLWLLSELAKKKLPLASRPLLVPLSLPISLDSETFLIYCQALEQLGIELGLAGEQSILVRSLPSMVPHLNLKKFLTAFFTSPECEINKLLELLAASQTFQAQQLQPEERAILINFAHTLTSDKVNNIAKHLTLETCWGLLNA